ncbi:DUF7502 family protein [Methanohalophilus halophilus]|uniref:Uncharacterized protein n=1 Tax=Methanohalophilus halophilus TaxID=2177 RepID=A0A1L3Q3U6_9EURY|nr:hypothetical protein [Methanohalophilus halophilus]APH39556.1 hypothetical protein BHR79_08735 [Methanohalophilus halophilus]RNI09112.1 hypothetical protein EFE40_06540 [Methanohalophilus halophilus]SDW30663.1 hypothetical protein SAMN04515625_0655 [Methanohalophilus halophilus]
MTGAEDLEKFIHRQENAVRKYQRLFKLAEFVILTLAIYTVLLLVNMENAFGLVRALELYAEKSYNVASLTISFSTIALLLISIGISLTITLLLYRREKSTSVILLAEEKYPVLKERLRTAYDNRKLSNIIANDLIYSVLESTKEIHSSAFLDRKKLKVILILLIFTSSTLGIVIYSDFRTDITPEGMKEVIDNIPGIPDNDDTPEDYFPSNGEGNEAGNENITGEPVVVVVEGEEVDLSIPPGSESGFTPTGEEDETQPEFKPSSSYEIGQMTAPAYREELPQGYEPIIKSYFEELTR